MEFREDADGCLITTIRYAARIRLGDPPFLEVRCDSGKLFRLPLISGLSSHEAEERLSRCELRWGFHPFNGLECRVKAQSSLWRSTALRP